MQDQYFEFLEYLGVSREPVEWKLGPWAHEREAQRTMLASYDRPVACLAVGSSEARREWDPTRWAELSDSLYHDFGLQPVLVGGPSPRELETERRIRASVRHPIESTLGSSLREMVWLIDGAALVIALNSAPLHISVAVNTPVIGLMAHRNPKRTGPYGFRELMVDAYGAPGEDYPISLETRTGGLEKVRVEDVLERVHLWRERYGAANPNTPPRSDV